MSSFIPWLGATRFNTSVVSRQYEVTLGKMLQTSPSSPTDVQVPYANSASIQWTGVSISDETKMWASTNDLRNLHLRRGDLLVCEGGDVGRCAIFNGSTDSIFQNSVHRVRPRPGANNRYLYYVLCALHASGYLDVLTNKATIRHFTSDKFGSLIIPWPELEEQRRIADFLDAETTRIDKLIRLRSEQLILINESLKTKAVSLVGRLKVRGIEKPDSVVQLRRALDSVQTGLTPPGLLDRDEIDSEQRLPWYTPAALDGLLSVHSADKYLSSPGAGPLFHAGSVLLTGVGESLGKVGYLDHEATGNQQLTALKPASFVNSRFIAWQLWAAEEEIREWSQYSRVRIINNDSLKSFPTYLPSRLEQESVAGQLDQILIRVREVQKLVCKFELLAAERRQALITAAVTGEFDVSTASGRGIEE